MIQLIPSCLMRIRFLAICLMENIHLIIQSPHNLKNVLDFAR